MHVTLASDQFNATQTLSSKDVYSRLCTCLDREIELVWKRAVFLTAFLIACFAGYGGLIATYLGNEKKSPGDFAVVSIAAIGIAFIGMALSVIWIMMAKGSKAWQEHYEKVIECFVAKQKSDSEATKKSKDDPYLSIFASGNYLATIKDISLVSPHLKKKKMSSCFLDSFGGPFSVSKILIALGRLFFLVWMCISFVHSLYLSFHHCQLVIAITRFFGGCPVWLVVLFQSGAIILLVILVYIMVVYVCCRFCNGCGFCKTFTSDYLSSLQGNEKIKEDDNG